MKRVAELEKLISQANHDYYNAQPTVTDAIFDAWTFELKLLSPNSHVLKSVGAPVPAGKWAKVRHGFVMGSLDKVNTPAEMKGWIDTHASGLDLLTMEKLDGLSIRLAFLDGKLTEAVTRGDGTEGENILANVKRMQSLPAKMSVPFTGNIRGEIILKKSDHAKHCPEHANPRNAASGICKRSDGKGSEHLTVMVYKVVDSTTHAFKTEEEVFQFLKSDFLTPNRALFQPKKSPQDHESHWGNGPDDMRTAYQKSERAALDYDIDGLVIAINDLAIQDSLGSKDGRPKGAVAYKFEAEEVTTTIRGFDWQVGGTGRITPVAFFDTVLVAGAKITNASCYNVAYINELSLGVGAEVIVVRANDVIPRVKECVKAPKNVEIPPKHCPICNTETVVDGEYITCPNTADCSAQTEGRIKRYLSVIDVLEWGGSLIEKLVAANLVKNPADLYKLTQNQIANLERMADKSAANVLATLHAKKLLPLETVLGALSVPMCGASTFTLLMDAGLDTFEKMRDAKMDVLKKIPGIGPVKAETLHLWFRRNGNIFEELLIASGITVKLRVKGSFTGKSFCFTGAMVNPRKLLEGHVTAKGGVVKSSAGKGCSYLVIADPASTSTKAVSARKSGVSLISEAEFLKMVQE